MNTHKFISQRMFNEIKVHFLALLGTVSWIAAGVVLSYFDNQPITVTLGFVLIFVGVAAFCLCFLAMRQPVAEGGKRARNAP